MSLAQNLKSLRTKKRWSLSFTAQKLGVPTSTYRGWESGRKMSAEDLEKVSQVFGVSMSGLLGKEDDRNEALKKSIYYLEEALDLVRQALR